MPVGSADLHTLNFLSCLFFYNRPTCQDKVMSFFSSALISLKCGPPGGCASATTTGLLLMAESVAAQNNKKEQFQENQADETAAAAAADSREGEGGAAADTQVFFDAENSEHYRSLDDQVHLPSPGLHEHKSEPDTTPAATSANDEAEAHATVVAALRLEISDLTGQVTSLNSKLVNAYGRIGDLEDESDRAEGKAGYLKQRVTTLEQERSQWEERVEGGLLVEKVYRCMSFHRLRRPCR